MEHFKPQMVQTILKKTIPLLRMVYYIFQELRGHLYGNREDFRQCRELGFSFLPNFQLPGKRKIFEKPFGNSGIREIFSRKFPELDCYAFFSGFQHFKSHFPHFVILF